jgi:hypothetical protein
MHIRIISIIKGLRNRCEYSCEKNKNAKTATRYIFKSLILFLDLSFKICYFYFRYFFISGSVILNVVSSS